MRNSYKQKQLTCQYNEFELRSFGKEALLYMRNSTIARNSQEYLENYWIHISRSDRFLQECASINYKAYFTKDAVNIYYGINKVNT